MKSHAQVVVIGGGVVGASVLYHLTKLGWRDVTLIERSELTAGSTWHAAAGFHAINADANLAALQEYTIQLYKKIEAESGQSVGMHMTGGVTIAGSPQRWEWLKSAWAVFQTLGLTDARLVTPDEIRELCPIVDVSGVYGGLFDPNEGHVDPYGATQAYAKAARNAGAEVVLRNRVLDLRPLAAGGWLVVTEQGTCHADHVVNAAGLWAKQVGLMAGVDLPVIPMEHHYLITEPIPEVVSLGRELPVAVDMEGFTYLRQEGQGVLLGVYELNPKHWSVDGAPWDYGIELLPVDVDRISGELTKGFERFPCLARAGIKKWVNGAFTFTPDGNPLVGPVTGVRNYWVACGVMAGFSQGGGVGKSLAEWIVHGEPSVDVFGMDVARYGPFASNLKYLKATTAQFYSRRFVLTYPNEQLMAGRPLREPGAHRQLTGDGARWGSNWGLEIPLYFAPAGFTETPTLRRSEAHEIVAQECRTARDSVGILDVSGFSRFEITGHGAHAWLDGLLSARLPAIGGVRRAPMLSSSGRLIGDLTVLRWDADTWWLMGSYNLRQWHARWFDAQRPTSDVRITDVSDTMAGFAIFGPLARQLLSRLTDADVSPGAFPFMACRRMDVSVHRAKVARLSITGELGYELSVPYNEHAALYARLREAGRDFRLAPIGYNAALSLRLEKSFGIWAHEFGWRYTPHMCGLSRFVAPDKGEFVGRQAFVEGVNNANDDVLVTLEVEARDADASGFEPLWHANRRVGFITSGGFGHTVGKSLAMGYVTREIAAVGTELETHIVGEPSRCRIVPDSPHDPSGKRMRA